MASTTTLDKAGRIVIPKAVRDELNLAPGDPLELKAEGDCLTIRPARPATRLHKERGVWVFQSGERVTANETRRFIQEMREERGRGNSGRLR